ncbi:Eco57I restriction-modification methylase domain-containing protein [Methylobacterium sp. M6A4_1b]
MPIEILGSVYERFLGSIIDDKGNVTPKPEIRRQGGVFYTPEHIVAHIVDAALTPLLEGRTPEQMRRIRVLDPACGSGTFLIRALEKLFQAHIHYYHLNADKRDRKFVYIDPHGDLKLTSELKKRIARECIFGVDIDRQAVEVSEMSIYLKILEGETQSTLGRQRVLFPNETFLPDLSGNIHVGNSLIGTDAYALLPAGLRTVEAKPFSWETAFPEVHARGWFDAVIGNPPYDVIEKERGAASWPHDVFRAYLAKTDRLDAAKGGKLNLFRFFLIQSLQRVRPNGYLGMIVPLALLADFSCKKTRLSVLDQLEDLNARAFPQKDIRQHRVFYDAKLSTVVVGGRKRPSSRRRHNARIGLHLYPRASFDDPSQNVAMRRSELAAIDPLGLPIPITDQDSWELAKKLHQSNSVARLDGIRITRGEINQTTYRDYITDNPGHSRLLKGVEVSAYGIHRTLSQGRVEWFDRARYERSRVTPDAVDVRRIATQRITGVDERHRIVATLSEPGWYFADSTNSVVVAPTCRLSLEYILACLNSRLLQWRFQLTSSNNNVGTNELAALPIRLLDLGDASEARTHAAIVAQVGHLMQLRDRLNTTPSVKVRAEAIQRFKEVRSGLDRTLGTLYNLTANEAALVDRRFGVP